MLTVLDIGARGGAHPRWRPLSRAVRFIGLDADAAECERLNRLASPVRATYLPYVVGERDGETGILHVTAHPDCSSLYPPNADFLCEFPYGRELTVTRTVPVTLTSLDTICRKHEIAPDVIKIDTQGCELSILRGGGQALASALVVELEAEFNPQYFGRPLFGDVDREIRERGFLLLGIRRSAWRRQYGGSPAGGTLVHGDALYCRHPFPGEPAARRRMALALAAYRQCDLARELNPRVRTHHAPSLAQRALGRIAARLVSHQTLRAWVDGCRPPGARDWHDPEFF